MTFSSALTYLGRSHDSDENALHGYIEMLCTKDSICSLDTLNATLQDVIYGVDVSQEYDELGRLSQKQVSHLNENIITNQYTFKKNIHHQEYSSLLVDQEKIIIPNNQITRNYQYNDGGLISSINDEEFGNATYSYNYQGFIEKEIINGYQYSYQYDNNGNIISIIKSSSNTTSQTTGFVLSSNNSTSTKLEYSNNIKDLVTKINDDSITYSGLYPLLYRGKHLSWNANRLIGCDDYSFEYNDQNLLTKIKQNGNVVTSLYYEGNKLIKEVDSNYDYPIYYLYDNNDELYGLSYNNNVYFYIRDSLANILGLVDNQGEIVVKYQCNAYGELVSCNDYSNINLSEINKFLFKGYYYEKHLGLYYLISRFYDPTSGRFISPDKIDYLNPKSINGLNLYSYCKNDPVNQYDPSGHLAITIAAIGTILLYAGLIALCVAATATLVYKESQTHTIGNAIDDLIAKLQKDFDDIKKSIIEFVSTLVPKNHYDRNQKHHIVAQNDPRAEEAREILKKYNIDIDSDKNTVYMKNDYHRVIHTNAYYTLVNASIKLGDELNGQKGVETVLSYYREILGRL
jgi:RHS repeat-associated protein